jgi:hypothetical protein
MQPLFFDLQAQPVFRQALLLLKQAKPSALKAPKMAVKSHISELQMRSVLKQPFLLLKQATMLQGEWETENGKRRIMNDEL